MRFESSSIVVVGMIFAIPLTAVIYTLLRDLSREKEAKRMPVPVEESTEDEQEMQEELKEDESKKIIKKGEIHLFFVYKIWFLT